MNIKFTKINSSYKDCLFLKVNFAGGDADTKHPEMIKLNIKFSEYQNHIDEIKLIVDKYLLLKKILGEHDIPDYEKIESEYGEDILSLYDSAPNDPQSDYQYKCYISSLYLIGYDDDCNEYQSFL